MRALLLGPRLAALAALAVGCTNDLPATGHVLLYLDTDAPLPRTGASSGPETTPPALFDRVRVDVYRDGETDPCDGCTRDFSVTEDLVRRGASMTVVAKPGTRPRVRVRWALSAIVAERGYEPTTTLETWAALPAVPADGAVEATVVSSTEAVGAPNGSLDAPIDAVRGHPASLAGTFDKAQRRPCAGDAKPHEVCLPGGVYWMGNPIVPEAAAGDVVAMRLVALAPFWLMDHEVTVAEFRAGRDKTASDHLSWSGSTAGAAEADWCTYTAEPSARDGLAMSCVSVVAARTFCQHRGGDLPTEAQFEYAASAFGTRLYVWGSDAPDCAAAVYGRGGTGVLDRYASTCLGFAKAADPTSIGGPLTLPLGGDARALAAASRARDQLALSTGTLYDLAGNLREWMRDQYQLPQESCWNPAKRASNFFVDPVCTSPNAADATLRSTRSGDWVVVATDLRAAYRSAAVTSADGGNVLPDVGFRCVRSGE